jgi:hypothetical protein
MTEDEIAAWMGMGDEPGSEFDAVGRMKANILKGQPEGDGHPLGDRAQRMQGSDNRDDQDEQGDTFRMASRYSAMASSSRPLSRMATPRLRPRHLFLSDVTPALPHLVCDEKKDSQLLADKRTPEVTRHLIDDPSL